MGTNYYVKDDSNNFELHIGKNSVGWEFLFHAHETPFLHSAQQLSTFLRFVEIIPHVGVYNEYGEEVSIDDFWTMVDSAKSKGLKIPFKSWTDSEGCRWASEDFS
jgi:hypothetical protein